MCGRLLGPDGEINEPAMRMLYESRPGVKLSPRNHNVGPEQATAVLFHEEDHAVLDSMVWAWHPTFLRGAPLVNGHAETAPTKPTFAAAFRERRCVIPSGGFYEWRTVAPKTKLPFLFSSTASQQTYLAGLWQTETSPKDGKERQRFIVLTTAPNALVADVHDRMALILDPEDVVRWLDPAATVDDLRALCRPYPAERMVRRPVSPLLNKVANKGPEVLEPPPTAAAG